MLAQNFKSSADLGLEDEEVHALIKVLGMLEREEVSYHEAGEGRYGTTDDLRPFAAFNMEHFFADADCGTVACICGWAIHLGNLDRKELVSKRLHIPALEDLFDPYRHAPGKVNLITTQQAAAALRSYLTTGKAHWKLALRHSPQETQSE
jgi:hypothetical protein